MFENLVESQIKRQRSWRQSFLSLVFHGLLIFAAVKATQGMAEPRRDRPIDTTMVYLKPPQPTRPPPPSTPSPPQDPVVVTNPPPKGFQTIVPPTEIPKEIPAIDLNQKPFDPRDFTGKGAVGGSGMGVEGGSGPVTQAPGSIYIAGDLDDPVQPISIPDPRYPPALKSAMIEGKVELQYVVDTTGHAEPNSFKVMTATHQAFVSPAKEAIVKGVFKPARFRGKPVRQLVQQAISFKVRQ